MSPQQQPMQVYREACQLARDHGCFVIHRSDSYVLYRRQPDRNVFIGRRTTAAGLRRLVCNAIGSRHTPGEPA